MLYAICNIVDLLILLNVDLFLFNFSKAGRVTPWREEFERIRILLRGVWPNPQITGRGDDGPTVGALNAESPKRVFSGISKKLIWSRY